MNRLQHREQDDAQKKRRNQGATDFQPIGLGHATIQRARQAPGSLAAGDVIALQRSAGNQAVLQLLGRQDAPPSVQRSAITPVGPGQTNVVQLNRNRKERRARERQATKGRRNQLRKQKLQEAKSYASYTKTLSEWGSWAYDWGSWAVGQASEIGTGVLTKTLGVNPVEIGTTLVGVARSNLSVKNKLLYLALYGSYQATEYLKNNLDTIVGGQAGELMKMQSDIDEQLEKAAKLWEQGGLTDEDMEDEVKNQIIDYLAGD